MGHCLAWIPETITLQTVCFPEKTTLSIMCWSTFVMVTFEMFAFIPVFRGFSPGMLGYLVFCPG